MISRVVIAALLAGGCAGDDACDALIPVAVDRPSEAPSQGISAQVPSFAGFYCENGNFVIALTSEAAADREAAAAMIDARTMSSCGAAPQIEFRLVRYTFLALSGWRDALFSSFLDSPGAVGLYIDYVGNRIGMEQTIDAAPGAVAFAHCLDMPGDAYTTQIVEPIDE